MKAPLALALAGSLLLGAPLAAFAQTNTAVPAQHQHGDFAAKKDAYLRDTHSQMDDWGRKIDQVSKEAATRGKQAGDKASRDLHRAWLDTQRASRRLAAATESGWEKARVAFERASTRLKRDWDRETAR